MLIGCSVLASGLRTVGFTVGNLLDISLQNLQGAQVLGCFSLLPGGLNLAAPVLGTEPGKGPSPPGHYANFPCSLLFSAHAAASAGSHVPEPEPPFQKLHIWTSTGVGADSHLVLQNNRGDPGIYLLLTQTFNKYFVVSPACTPTSRSIIAHHSWALLGFQGPDLLAFLTSSLGVRLL